MRKMLSLFCVILPIIMVSGCSRSNNPVGPALAPANGQLLFAMDASENIASGTVTITKGHLTHMLPITIADHTGSVTFTGIQVGHWNIQVQLFDAEGAEIYTGAGEAIVTQNTTTTATIRVDHNTGNLEIIVDVPGLILWSKLGSQAEVENSAEGPAGSIAGELLYLAGQHGNGMRPAERTGDKNIVNNYIQYSGLTLSEKGCIEFWYLPDWSNPSVGHIVDLFTYGDPLDVLGCRIIVQYNDWQDRLTFGVFDNTQSACSGKVFVPSQVSGWSTTQPFHLAFTWDGTQPDTIQKTKIYLNGVEIGSDSSNGSPTFSGWPTSLVMNLASRLLSGDWDRHNWDGGHGVIDNLKIWDYPKTDFTDRFAE